MVITRMVDGVLHEFKLSKQELIDAYFEQEYNFDTEDVLGHLNSSEDDVYDVSIDELKNAVDRIVYEYRRNMDDYEMCWYDAREHAIQEIAGRLEEEKYRK